MVLMGMREIRGSVAVDRKIDGKSALMERTSWKGVRTDVCGFREAGVRRLRCTCRAISLR